MKFQHFLSLNVLNSCWGPSEQNQLKQLREVVQLMITRAADYVPTYHLAPSKVIAADLDTMISAQTVQGGVLHIASRIGVKVNDLTVIQTDVKCTNGVIHVIDTVLTPK